MKFGDLIKETVSSTGAGAFITSGAVSPFRAFAAVYAVGDRVPYKATQGSAFEIGVGTKTAGGIARTTVTASSNNGQLVDFAAGVELIANLGGAQLAKFETGTSTRVVYLSNYCISDTDLSATAPVAGTDQRAKVQAVVDAEGANPLRVVWDVKITMGNVPDGSGDTLRLHSNTEIIVLNGCGALQAAGSVGWMISNYNTTTNANNNFASITDENITIDGGIWNGNRGGQGTSKNDVFHWSGVRNLVTRNYKVVNASGMAHRLINTDGHKNQHYEIDFGAGNTGINTDGMHYHGPARAIRDRGGRILNCGDDSYALNADDAWGEANFTGRYDNVYGPITDALVEDLTINAAVFGVRMLSGQSRIDDIRFRNVRGSTSGYSFLIDNYLTPAKATLSGPGNFGNIEVDGWHMVNTFRPSWLQMAMHISAKAEQLSLRNITKGDFNDQQFPIIRIGEKASIDQLAIDNFKSKNYNGGTYNTDQIVFAPGANVRTCKINGAIFDAPTGTGGYPINVNSGATIRTLQLAGCSGSNFDGFVQNNGTVTNLLVPASNFMDTAVVGGSGGASTWVLPVGSKWVEDTAVPGKITQSTNHSDTVDSAKKTTSDGFGGNVAMTGTVRFKATSLQGSLHAAFIVRGASVTPWSSVSSGYAFDMFCETGGGLKLFKIAGGSQPTLGAAMVVPFAFNEDYHCALIAKTVSGTTTVSLTIQRGSDSLYLQPNATWAATATAAISATDTSIPAAAGEWGVYAFNNETPSASVEFTNLSIAAAP